MNDESEEHMMKRSLLLFTQLHQVSSGQVKDQAVKDLQGTMVKNDFSCRIIITQKAINQLYWTAFQEINMFHSETHVKPLHNHIHQLVKMYCHCPVIKQFIK